MKYVVILGDGMADRPLGELGGRTPLEAAYKPNIDGLCAKGEIGLVKTVPDSLKPGSDVANLAVMGYAPEKYYSGRSPLEAVSMGLKLADDDIAVRCNLVTLSDESRYEDKTMLDYSAGEISTAEAAELIAAVQSELGSGERYFTAGVSYRHCMVMRRAELGTEYTPPHDITGKKIADSLPKGKYGEESLALMKRSYEILKDHPVNAKRIAEGKNSANSIWLWGEGTRPALPLFTDKNGVKGAVISAVDLIKGIGICAGMEICEVEGATGTLDTNFRGKAEAAIRVLEEGCDYVYIHMEAPDECGHQGDVKGKVRAIELIDREVVGCVIGEMDARGWEYKVLVMPDHPTPLSIRTHSREAVPYALYRSGSISGCGRSYNERNAAESGVYYDDAPALIDRFIKEK